MKRGTKLIINAKLTTFNNEYPDKEYVISLTCTEFTALCPMSGFPDFGTIYINYVPDKKCVELKSLKLYINKILDDFVATCKPRWVLINGDYNVRGNIKTVVKAEYLKRGCRVPSPYLTGDRNKDRSDVTKR